MSAYNFKPLNLPPSPNQETIDLLAEAVRACVDNEHAAQKATEVPWRYRNWPESKRRLADLVRAKRATVDAIERLISVLG